jgi:hypothetical protein
MNRLFKDELFDGFDVRDVEIVTFTRFEISGVHDKSGLTEEEASRETAYYLSWARLKPYAFNIIKGSRRPRLMKIIFSMSPERAAEFNANASALFINMNFENNELVFTTGSSQKNFSLDKSLELAWDDYVSAFFSGNGLRCTVS